MPPHATLAIKTTTDVDFPLALTCIRSDDTPRYSCLCRKAAKSEKQNQMVHTFVELQQFPVQLPSEFSSAKQFISRQSQTVKPSMVPLHCTFFFCRAGSRLFLADCFASTCMSVLNSFGIAVANRAAEPRNLSSCTWAFDGRVTSYVNNTEMKLNHIVGVTIPPEVGNNY